MKRPLKTISTELIIAKKRHAILWNNRRREKVSQCQERLAINRRIKRLENEQAEYQLKLF